MNFKRKDFLQTGVAAGAGAALLGGIPAMSSAAGPPIRLGVIPPLTGANALLGEQGLNGATLAVDEINAKGGVFDGRKFEMIVEDATNDNQSSVAALNKLIERNVDAIVLPVLSTQIQAMAPVMKQHEIPWMTGGTAVKNTQLGVPWLFRLRASDGITAEALVFYAVKEKKAKKVGILHASDAFGTGGADQCVTSLKKLGMDAVANEQYPKETKDFTPELLKIKQAGADAMIIYIQNPSDTAIVLQQIRSLGLKMTILGSPSLGNQTALDLAQKNADGIYVARDFIVGFNTNVATHFITAYYRRFKKLPDVGTGSGWVYDGVYLLRDTMRKLKSTDKHQVVTALHKTKNWEGVMGKFTADAEGNMIHELSIAQVQNGQVKFVKKFVG